LNLQGHKGLSFPKMLDYFLKKKKFDYGLQEV